MAVLGSALAMTLTELQRHETVCKCLHVIMTCFRLSCVNEEDFLNLYTEGSFVWLPVDDMATVIDNCSHVFTRQVDEIWFATQ